MHSRRNGHCFVSSCGARKQTPLCCCRHILEVQCCSCKGEGVYKSLVAVVPSVNADEVPLASQHRRPSPVHRRPGSPPPATRALCGVGRVSDTLHGPTPDRLSVFSPDATVVQCRPVWVFTGRTRDTRSRDQVGGSVGSLHTPACSRIALHATPASFHRHCHNLP